MEKKSFHHGGMKFTPWWNEIYSMMERLDFRISTA